MCEVYVFSELNLNPNEGLKFVIKSLEGNSHFGVYYIWMDKGHIILKFMQGFVPFQSKKNIRQYASISIG